MRVLQMLTSIDYDEPADRYPLIALQFFTRSGTQIRLYRNTPRTLQRTRTQEWAYDQGSGKWTINDLPVGLTENSDGSVQPSSVAWTTSDNKVHIRLYQNKGYAADRLFVSENSFDEGDGWRAMTASIDQPN